MKQLNYPQIKEQMIGYYENDKDRYMIHTGLRTERKIIKQWTQGKRNINYNQLKQKELKDRNLYIMIYRWVHLTVRVRCRVTILIHNRWRNTI